MPWYRNKRSKGWSRWHYDDTPEAPGFMKQAFPVDLNRLPLSICETAYHDLMLDETSDEQPPEDECCALCLDILRKRKQMAFEL